MIYKCAGPRSVWRSVGTHHQTGLTLFCCSRFVVPWKPTLATKQHCLSDRGSQKSPQNNSHTFFLMNTICWLWANVDPSPDPCSYQCARQTLKFTRPTMNVTVQVWCGVEKADWKCFILSILYRKVHEMQRSYRFFPRRRSCVYVNMLRWAVSVAVNKEQRKLYVSKTSDVLILFFLSD